MKKYRTILIDPPWPIKWPRNKAVRVKQLSYQTMPVGEIALLDVPSLAHTDCTLLLWTTNQYLPDAMALCRLWKFQYEGLFTWCKRNGMGGRPRNATEHFVIATRGLPAKADRHQPMLLNWLVAKNEEHSKKPEIFYGIIESFTLPPRIELFARQKRKGWDVWGNDVASDIERRLTH